MCRRFFCRTPRLASGTFTTRANACASVRPELGLYLTSAEPAVDLSDDVAKRRERVAFLLLTAVVFPLLTVMIVAGYGFMVWI